MNKAETAKVMTYIFADFDIAIPESKLMVWYDQLKEVPYADAMKAARLVVSRKSYGPPRVSDLLESIKAATPGIIDESQVYSLAMEAVQRFGYYQREAAMTFLRSKDPRLAIAVNRYGWAELCMEDTSRAGTTRAHLWKVFSAVQKSDDVNQVLRIESTEPMIQLELPKAKSIT